MSDPDAQLQRPALFPAFTRMSAAWRGKSFTGALSLTLKLQPTISGEARPQACAGAEACSPVQPERAGLPGSLALELDALPGAGGASALAVALSSVSGERASW